jgi:hypothetical protein
MGFRSHRPIPDGSSRTNFGNVISFTKNLTMAGDQQSYACHIIIRKLGSSNSGFCCNYKQERNMGDRRVGDKVTEGIKGERE